MGDRAVPTILWLRLNRIVSPKHSELLLLIVPALF
jgi:hypothetical protein